MELVVDFHLKSLLNSNNKEEEYKMDGIILITILILIVCIVRLINDVRKISDNYKKEIKKNE